MNNYFWIIILCLMVMIITRRKNIIKHIVSRKFGGNQKMEEIVKSFIDKDVEIHLLESGMVLGTIIKYNDGWIIYKDDKDIENALNCFYITQIKPSKQLENIRAKKAKKENK
ncbi:MAG: hypothetical protein IJW82_01980 [Clostridia bacterium]|nr:hypothetical protein [Clostridia bacterium]